MSSTSNPTVAVLCAPRLSWLARSFRRYPNVRIASLTLAAVPLRTRGSPLMTRDTVITPTPATFATSRIVGRPGTTILGTLSPAAQGGFPLHSGQLFGVAYGVEAGDEAVVDTCRHDSVDLAVEPENERRVAVDLCQPRHRGGDP